MKITPVILSGGSGTRLWPLSRKSYPKQFVNLIGAHTPFQASARRLTSANGLTFAPPLVLTNADFRFIVTEQLAEAGLAPGAILIEPEGRNTAPAVLAAALHVAASDPDGVLLVAPSDHDIPDRKAFHDAVTRGLEAVAEGKLVTFGISPDRPETAYGYLELSTQPDGSGAPIALSRFVEKPDASGAAEMLAAGNYLWNAGIFLFAARDILAAFETHAPALVEPTRAAVAAAQADLGFLRLAPAPWSTVEEISIDYAVMEKARNLAVVPFSGHWSDLGGWDSVWREMEPDADGVVAGARATAIDCRDTLLRSESEQLEVVGIGLEGITWPLPCRMPC